MSDESDWKPEDADAGAFDAELTLGDSVTKAVTEMLQELVARRFPRPEVEEPPPSFGFMLTHRDRRFCVQVTLWGPAATKATR